MDSSTLQAQKEHALVSFIGRVVDMGEARDGRQLNTIELKDGYQVSVYVADDAEHPNIALGHKYKFSNLTVLGTGFMTLNKPNSVSSVHVYENGRMVTARVYQQMAMWQGLNGVYRIPAPGVPDGSITGQVVSIDGRERFTVSSND